ncbi:putative short chain dehydrogenase [Kalaharituber pfeilii]|nr:putative short chain dehydrogenase [Kalaharituber pfeilii]
MAACFKSFPRQTATTNQQAGSPSPADHSFPSSRRLPEFRLDGKIILISGGVGGVGLKQSEALMEAGAHVYALDRVPKESLPQEYYILKERGEKELGTLLDYRKVDVRNPTELNEIIEAIGNKHGRMDGLVAAAGINRVLTAFEHTAADFDEILGINVTGVFLCAQAVAKQMVKFQSGGSIALIASMSGTIANKDLIWPAYNTSKAAVLQLARSLAMEWGVHGIRVNTISPGYIVTPMVTAIFDQDPSKALKWPQENMLGRLSKPEEYRGAAVFLLSDASSYMTASDLIIDGGHHSW